MNRIFAAALCLTVPGLIFLNAWQGYRYSALADKVAELEKQQKDLLSANRDIIGQIAYETSAARVAEKAAALGLVPSDHAGGGFSAAGSDAAAGGSDAGASGVAVTRLQAAPDSTGGPAQ